MRDKRHTTVSPDVSLVSGGRIIPFSIGQRFPDGRASQTLQIVPAIRREAIMRDQQKEAR